MRKYFKGLRQSEEAWGSTLKVSGSLRKHEAAWCSIRKHFKGHRQSEEAWGIMEQHEETL